MLMYVTLTVGLNIKLSNQDAFRQCKRSVCIYILDFVGCARAYNCRCMTSQMFVIRNVTFGINFSQDCKNIKADVVSEN